MNKDTGINLYHKNAFKLSEQVARDYSTSFYLATRQLDKESRKAVFSIYGFVRLADEIVDSFHGFNKVELLSKFEADYREAFKENISLNPILHAFQTTVKKYDIPDEYVSAFLDSMKADLYKNTYNSFSEITQYIYGSADVVGLMCLKVFCNGDNKLFQELEEPAMKLGSAFQKVNFLRDLKNDVETLDRTYFPNLNRNNFDEQTKGAIIRDIEQDFVIALSGIKRLPRKSRVPVYIAYLYYRYLLQKLKDTQASRILSERIRINNLIKLFILLKVRLMHSFNLL